MRVLAIGGLQFMGRALVERLVARGHEVAVLHRRDHHDLGSQVRNLQSDRADLPTMTAILGRERFDVVYDLAYDFQKGTPASQVEAAARSCGDRLQRYVFMSSIAAYGPGIDHRESEALAPDDFPDPYTVHKASAERALFRMHAASGFPVVTFRPPFVHGPRQPFYREQFFWDRLLAHRPIILPDGGDAPMQWAYSDDVAEACLRAIEVPEAAGEAFNIGHVERTTQRTFVEALARVVGVEPEFVAIPRAAILAAGGQLFGDRLYFGEFLDLPPFTEVVEKVTKVLGVTPTGLEDALATSFTGYRAQPQRPQNYEFEDGLIRANA
jgi:nucleoside-diphosphate-sugar epimerase